MKQFTASMLCSALWMVSPSQTFLWLQSRENALLLGRRGLVGLCLACYDFCPFSSQGDKQGIHVNLHFAADDALHRLECHSHKHNRTWMHSKMPNCKKNSMQHNKCVISWETWIYICKLSCPTSVILRSSLQGKCDTLSHRPHFHPLKAISSSWHMTYADIDCCVSCSKEADSPEDFPALHRRTCHFAGRTPLNAFTNALPEGFTRGAFSHIQHCKIVSKAVLQRLKIPSWHIQDKWSSHSPHVGIFGQVSQSIWASLQSWCW